MDSGATGILLMTYVSEFTGLKIEVNLSSPIRYISAQSRLTWEGQHCRFVFVSQFSHVRHFVVKMKDFMAKMKDFVVKTKKIKKSFIFAKNPSSLPQCLSMCRHTNEGIPCTEHVQMLHWACAEIIVRGNPMTDMTDNTETQTQTDSVYTLV